MSYIYILSNKVRGFFFDLDFTIAITKGPGEWHTIILKDTDYSPERMAKLIDYYFTEYEQISLTRYQVRLETFDEDGHGVTGICKQCGCTQNDACPDPDTGSCYWVHEDLCSACALPDEKYRAMQEMKGLMGGDE